MHKDSEKSAMDTSMVVYSRKIPCNFSRALSFSYLGYVAKSGK
jgi:hypothetical protein